MDTKQADDKLFDAVFMEAIIKDYDDEINSIPSNQELAETYKLTSGFELHMKKIVHREDRKFTYQKCKKHMQRAAVILLAAASLLSGVLLTHPDVRAAVGNVITGWYEKFISFTFQEEDVIEKRMEIKNLYPGYLPEGYYEEKTVVWDSKIMIVFTNRKDEKLLFQYTTQSVPLDRFIDNEQYRIEEIEIAGNYGFFAHALSDTFSNVLVCTFRNQNVEIWGKVSSDEIIKIFRSIYEKE